MEFGNNLVPTRRTIYAIYRKFMKTGSVVSGVARVPCALGQEVFLRPSTKTTKFKVKNRCKNC